MGSRLSVRGLRLGNTAGVGNGTTRRLQMRVPQFRRRIWSTRITLCCPARPRHSRHGNLRIRGARLWFLPGAQAAYEDECTDLSGRGEELIRMSLSAQATPCVYTAPEVASHYAALDYLSPCEQLLFATYVKSGGAILDLGVGGGRTTSYLSESASRYVGVDYSAEMLKICRTKFPYLEFVQADAADMSMFSEESFDAIIFSFNGLDTLAPYEQIEKCLQECSRLLRSGGVLIFSSHNPRSVIVRPSWNTKRLRLFARNLVRGTSLLYEPTLVVATCGRGMLAIGSAWFASCTRLFQRMFSSAFWHGEGYLYDSAHGGLLIHCWIPERVLAEVQRFDFQHISTLGDDYPRTSREFITEWYYYVFEKAQSR